MELRSENGVVFLIDENDFQDVSQYKWFSLKSRSTSYLKRNVCKNDKNNQVYLHRHIMKPIKGLSVDHINGNGLDNRRSNLRVCTIGQNRSWGKPTKGRRFKGAYPHQNGWVAKIHKKYIGVFKTEEEAAIAYNKEAKKRYGEFAKLNEV